MLIAGKSRDQHNQRRFRQMEVGHQRINDFVLIARVDENLRIVKERLNQVVFCRLRRAFQRTHRRRPDGNHPVAARFCRQHRIDHLLRHFGIFRVHDVIFNAVYAHRLEGSGPNVQRDEGHLHAFFTKLRQQGLIKVQAGGWRGNGPRFFAIDGLIQLAVGVFVRTIDIRRQRHMADSVENIQHAARVIELNFKQRVVTCNHGPFNTFIVAEQQFCARFRRFRSANMCQNTLIIEHPLNQHFNLAAAGFTAKQTGRDHAGIIKYQQIARVELIE